MYEKSSAPITGGKLTSTAPLTRHLRRNRGHEGRSLGGVAGDRVAAAVLDLRCGAEGGSDGLDKGLDPRFAEIPHHFAEGAHGAAERCCLRDDVVSITRSEDCDRDNSSFEGIDVARHDRLERTHDMAAHKDRINAVIRACRVAASALDGDGEAVGCGHHGTGPESKEPDRDGMLCMP